MAPPVDATSAAAVVVVVAAFDDKLVFAIADAILFDAVIDDAEVVNCDCSNL